MELNEEIKIIEEYLREVLLIEPYWYMDKETAKVVRKYADLEDPRAIVIESAFAFAKSKSAVNVNGKGWADMTKKQRGIVSKLEALLDKNGL